MGVSMGFRFGFSFLRLLRISWICCVIFSGDSMGRTRRSIVAVALSGMMLNCEPAIRVLIEH